ncbi:MAG: hypothetical protein Q9160_007626 [Pyrenula sp. 1 TL-2023]
MLHRKGLVGNLSLCLLTLSLFLCSTAASLERNEISPNLNIDLTPRDVPAATKGGGRPKTTQSGGQRTWEEDKDNAPDSDGPVVVEGNELHVEPAEVPKYKESKIKKDPDTGGSGACNNPCAGECCDARPPNQKSSHPKADWKCTVMIGQPNAQKFTTCCPEKQFGDKNGRCCPTKYLSPTTFECCTKKNKKKCKNQDKAFWNSYFVQHPHSSLTS